MPAEPQQISASAISRSSRPGMPRSSVAGLGAHALRVGEVAGVVVGDGHSAAGGAAATGPSSASSSADVADLGGERLRPLRPTPGRRAAGRRTPSSLEPQPAALTTTCRRPPPRTRRSSAGRTPGPPARGRCAATARRSSPALGDDDVAALGREHARGRGVDAGEELALHAAGQHARRSGARAARPRSRSGSVPAWRSGGARRSIAASVRGEPLEQPAAASSLSSPLAW